MGLLDKANKLPPCVCRLLARKNHGRAGLTNLEIAQASGLSLATVKSYCFRTTWEGIPIENVDAFARGCGVDLTRIERHVDFLKRRRWAYTENGTPQQVKFYRKLLELRQQ